MKRLALIIALFLPKILLAGGFEGGSGEEYLKDLFSEDEINQLKFSQGKDKRKSF